jgi:hypothetical protein
MFQNIMSLFQTPAAQPAAPTNPTGVANPGQPLPGTQASQQTAPNGVVPQLPGDPNAGGDPGNSNATPLEQFADIWQTPAPDASQDPSFFANVDPAKLMASAKKVDFAKTLTPEMLAAVAAGGEPAQKAFVQAMNAVAQTVYAQSALATTKIVDQALSKYQTSYDARLPNLVKGLSANESLVTENPIFSNPALQPIVQGLQQQFQRKNPSASAAEIKQQISAYFNAVGMQFAPKVEPTPQQKAAASEQDWSAFLG